MPHEDMKISELRKMLKEHRKTAVVPVSKMAKHHILMELEKYGASTPAPAPVVKQEKAVSKVVKEAVAPALPKPKANKIPASTLMQPEVSKKELNKAVEPEKQVARTRLIKGSAEAKEFMASIRMKKSKEKDVS